MLSFKERLQLLEHDLVQTPPDFVMSSDLPFALFRYDPTDPDRQDEREYHVRREVQNLATRVGHVTGKRVHVWSLADFYWNAINDAEDNAIDELSAFEIDRGFDEAGAMVNVFLTDEAEYMPLTKRVVRKVDQDNLSEDRDLIFMLRAGVFAPASYRISSLLEQLMGKVRIPTILFYPGTWRGSLNYYDMHGDNEPLGSYRVKIYGRDA